MTKVLIADDHSIVRLGMQLLLIEMYPEASIVEVDTFDKALTKVKVQPFDLLLLDIHIPGGDNLQMIDAIRLRQPDIGILMVSGYDEELYALRYIDAGADGYVSKGSPSEEVKTAIKKTARKEKYLSVKVQAQLLQQRLRSNNRQEAGEALSNREVEVMNLLAKGVGSREIKALLNIRDSTVSTYKGNIFRKMGVSNVIELANKLK